MTRRIVAILGDYYHDGGLAKKALEQAIAVLSDVKMEYTTVTRLVESIQTKPDAVILFAENRLNPTDAVVDTWMDEQAAKAISNYVKEGGGWIAWHSGLASYGDFEDYTSMLRGHFEYHPAKHQVVTYITENGTRLASGEKSFSFLDEHYFVNCDTDNTNVFLRSESVDGSSIAGWEHTHGKGRVVCLTPAHLEEGLLHPETTKLLKRAIEEVVGI